jgi:hypothetical protein
MELQDIINTDEDQAPIWVAYPDSTTFQVLTRPIGDRQKEFLEKSREVKWDEAAMEQKVVFNDEIYTKLFSGHVIVDWKGLHIEDLKKLVLLKNFKKFTGFTGDIACDDTAKAMLMKHSIVFDVWVNRICTNIELFNQEREEAEKKTS